MSRPVRLLLLVLLLALSACATTTTPRVAASSGSIPVDAQSDALYRARIEYIAQRRGVTVHWVNPPVTRTDLAAR